MSKTQNQMGDGQNVKIVGENISPFYHKDPLRAEINEVVNFYTRGVITYEEMDNRLAKLTNVSGLSKQQLLAYIRD